MKLYLSGPMTGLPCYNFPAFFYWEVVLSNRGHKVINPARIDCERMLGGWTYSEDQYDEILEEDLRLIRQEAEGVFMLNGWEESEGALMEINEARDKGIPIMFEEEE